VDHRPRNDLRNAGIVVLLWSLLNLPLLLGFRVLPGDAVSEFYPMAYFNVHSIHQGLAPWWNPYVFSGYPQVADPQSLLFSPLFMAWMLLRADPGTTWFVWGVLLHLLMGGIAMQALLSRIATRQGTIGPVIGAVVFMAGGVVAGRLQHVPIICAYAYVPVILLALRHFTIRPGSLRGLLLGVCVGAMLTQPAQTTLLLALLITAYAAGLFWSHRKSLAGHSYLHFLIGLALAIVVATAIALPQAAFTWAFLAISNRPGLSLEQSQTLINSLDARSLWTLLSPNALHGLRGNYDGPAGGIESFLYIGAIPALLMLGLGDAWKNPSSRRHLVFFGLAGLLAVLYSFGPNTPFYAWAYRWIPGVDKFRRPADAAFVLNLALAMIAGVSASHVDLASRRTMLTIVAVAAVWLALSSAMMTGLGESWQSATIAAALVAVVAFCFLARGSAGSNSIFWLLAVTVADYRCFNLNGKFNQWHDDARHFLHEPASKALAALMRRNGLPPRFEGVDTGTLWKNNTVLLDLPATQGYGPLQLALYNRFYGAYPLESVGPRPVSAYNPNPESRINQLLGVRYLVRQHSSAIDPALGQPVFAGSQVDIYKLQATYPRILVPSMAKMLGVGVAPSPMDFVDTDFLKEVWLTPRNLADQSLARSSAATCKGTARVLDASQTNVAVSIHVESPAPAWVVVSDLDTPGWRASANGNPLPIFRANGMFQALCVPPGDSQIALTFHPWLMVADVIRSNSTSNGINSWR
jgi:hypothetical protein